MTAVMVASQKALPSTQWCPRLALGDRRWEETRQGRYQHEVWLSNQGPC